MKIIKYVRKRERYHYSRSNYITIDCQVECQHCRSDGTSDGYHACTKCNGHRWLWGSTAAPGYGFKPYTLHPVTSKELRTMSDNVILLLSDDRGIYIPRDFARDFDFGDDGWQGVSEAEREVLADPHHEDYWEVWFTVLGNAYYIDKPSGKVYHLHQDGDLWALCLPQLTEEEKRNFGW